MVVLSLSPERRYELSQKMIEYGIFITKQESIAFSEKFLKVKKIYRHKLLDEKYPVNLMIKHPEMTMQQAMIFHEFQTTCYAIQEFSKEDNKKTIEEMEYFCTIVQDVLQCQENK